jgi:hypothetical protein
MKNSENIKIHIGEMKNQIFGWEVVSGLVTRDLIVEIKVQDPEFEVHQLLVDIDHINLDKEIIIWSKNKKQQHKFFITTVLEKNNIKLKVYGTQDKIRIVEK